jgi:hypothetical protein
MTIRHTQASSGIMGILFTGALETVGLIDQIMFGTELSRE